MKKAVIATGGKQYLVTEGEELLVEKLNTDKKKLDLEAYLVIDDKDISVGEPTVAGAKVSVSIVSAEVRAPKVRVMKFQSKKRVRTLRGHRQSHSKIKIDKITL